MSVPSFILLCFAAAGVLCYFHNRRAQLRLEVEPETHLSRVALAPAYVSSCLEPSRGPDLRPQAGAWRARRIEFEY